MSGRVRTLDPERPHASAVAIADGMIVAVGSDAEIRELAGASTEVIDLHGAAVIPGLTDSHLHPFLGADGALGADLLGVTSLDEVRRLVAAERARCAPGEWVLGYGLDYNAFAQSGTHGSLIEEAAGGNPALLTYMDFHTALATPRALELAGIEGPRAFEEHAEIVCVDGVPTGELRENAAMDLVHAVIPEPTPQERYDALREPAAALRRRRHDRRARHGRRPGDARPAARARGQRRPRDPPDHAVLDQAGDDRGALGASSPRIATSTAAAGARGGRSSSSTA